MSRTSSLALVVLLGAVVEPSLAAIRPLASRTPCENCPPALASSALQLSADFEVEDEEIGHQFGSNDPSIDVIAETNMTSCKERSCNQIYSEKYPCQCNGKCMKWGSCCEDYVAVCIYKESRDVGRKNDFKLLAHFWGAAAMIAVLTLAVAAWVWSALLVNRMSSEKFRDVVDLTRVNMEEEEEDFGHKLVLNWIYIRFLNWRVEEQYQEWSIEQKVKKSAQTLALGVMIMSGGLAFRLGSVFWSGCTQVNPLSALVAVGALVAEFALSVYCAIRPTEPLYWVTLLFAFLYVPFSNLPPMAPSCYTLAEECTGSDVSMIQQALRHADCSLQGQTSMQILLTWLLLSPWLIPRQEVIHLIWFWLLGIYLGWTVVYEYLTEMHVYSYADTMWRVFVLSVTLIVATSKKYYIEKSIRLKFAQEIAQRHESKKMFGILEVMMPTHVVVPMMRSPGKTITESIDCVSILFVLIADFDQFTREKTPKALLQFLNEQFTQYDEICERNKVTKIETVGEEYVAAVGVMPSEVEENKLHGHAPLLDRLITAGGEILGTQSGKVKLKMGIHTGPIVAGVIGNKLPRYRLFGDTINSAARMMQKGIPGQLQFGEETHAQISDAFKQKVEYRGEVEMKGKGKLKAWVYVPKYDPSDLLPDNVDFKSFSVEEDVPVAKQTSSIKKSGLSVLKRAGAMMRAQKSMGVSLDSALRNSTMENPEKEEAFNKALAELEASQAEELSRVHANGFDGELEQEWMASFHRDTFCKKIVRRFGMASLWILILTGCEYVFLLRLNVPITHFEHTLYPARFRMGVFLVARLLCLFINMVWWYLCESSKWLEGRSVLFQHLLLFSELANLTLIWTSYDAMGYSDNEAYNVQMQRRFQAPDDQSLILNFVLFFNISLSMHKFRYMPSLMYIPTLLLLSNWFRILRGLSLLLGKDLDFKWEDNFSYQGEFLLFFQLLMHMRVAHEEELASRSLFKASKSLKTTMERTQKILTTLMPEAVVSEIKDSISGELPCHQYRHLVIAQSDLCGFTQLSATKKPTEVVEFMGQLFGLFDDLTDVHKVYKVETVGDAYIAGMADAPLTKVYSPVNVILFGLDMVRATDEWAKALGVKVTCRVGIHYGECIGGVVGNQMQRYHLFGDTLTVMEVLESTSEEGRVQISAACKAEVIRQLADAPDAGGEEQLTFIERTVDMLRTSKGEEHTFEEVGGKTFLVDSDKPLRRQ